MRFSEWFKGFGVSAVFLAFCASQGNAAVQKITLGNATGADLPLNVLSTTPAVPADPLNPNQYAVFFAESALGEFGFLLDGSEWAEALRKRFEEGRANGTNVTFYYDDGIFFKTQHNMWSLTQQGAARKILYVSTGRVN
jgi:hypothetical protein